MRLTLRLCSLLLFASFVSITASSNQGGAKIKGTLFDSTDAVIPAARVTFRTENVQRRVFSNDEGVFEIELPSGEYEVEIEVVGFKKFEIKKLEVITGVVRDLTVHLEVLPYPACILRISRDQDERIEKEIAPLPEKIKPRKIQ